MGADISKVTVRYVKNMIGDDIPAHTIVRVGNLTSDDWDAMLDLKAEVPVQRGKLLTTLKQLQVAMRAMAWLMYKSGLETFEYLPEYDEEVENSVSIVMDHTADVDPIWRFRVFTDGEEENVGGTEETTE